MDFHTRDQYRHAVERIAKHSELSEKEVAELAIQSALNMAELNMGHGTSHVGYFFIGKGVA